MANYFYCWNYFKRSFFGGIFSDDFVSNYIMQSKANCFAPIQADNRAGLGTGWHELDLPPST